MLTLAIALPGTKITELCLNGNEIDDEGATHLFNLLPNTKIVNLKLHYNEISDKSVEKLAKALIKSETKLTTLDLSENYITGVGVESLAGALPDSNLTELDLHRDSKFWVSPLETRIIEIKFGDSIAQALASALANPKTKLTKLNINGNEVRYAGIKAIASALSENSETLLTELRIDGHIGDGGKAYTVHNMPGITDAGVIRLAAILPKTLLKTLSLNKNAIGDPGAKALAAVLSKSKLTELSLRTNKVGDNGAIALFSVLPYSFITSLILHGNKIGPNAAQVLANILPDPRIKITEIDLNCNKIGYLGLEAITKPLLSSNIKVLRVNDNKIGEGAQALANALNYNVLQQEFGIAKPKLTRIAIEDNKITDLVKENLWNAAVAANLEINIEYHPPVNIKEITGQVATNIIPQQNTETLLLYPYYNEYVRLNGFYIIENLMNYPKISTLIIHHIDPLNIIKLCEVLPQTSITKLIINDSNMITSDYIQQLANILPKTEITNLALTEFVDNSGAQALATAIPGSKLTELNLSDSPIGDNGAQALADALLNPNTKLINLNLQNCNITHNGGLKLITAWKQYLDQVANDPNGQGITTHYMDLIGNELFSSLNGEGINDIIEFIGANASLVRYINFIDNNTYSSPSKKVHQLLLDFLKICEFSIVENDEQFSIAKPL
ncbi:leucine-rich repeat domain-containing protein [Candidatus Trichorickettsia mobilis]|uniref:hypothetical protein n=1 Tax=Candidatus Trichorickettsia mobilis TaxID=1346319 RepID=UPI00292DDAB7|nr:hypothetical protein [Candidatus Trichorickettsia mobilis]